MHFMLQSLDQKSEAFCLSIHCWEVGYWTLPALGASASSSVKRWSHPRRDYDATVSVCVECRAAVRGDGAGSERLTTASAPTTAHWQRWRGDDVTAWRHSDVTWSRSVRCPRSCRHGVRGVSGGQSVVSPSLLPVCLISLQFSTLPLALLGL